MHTIAKLENINIRGSEIKKNMKNGEPYCIVRFEDEAGRPNDIVDKDEERFEFYKKNLIGDMWISIYQSRDYTTLRVVDFKIKKDEE